MTEQPNAGGRIVHAQLHLLDRQIVEHRTGRMVAKVDDVELDLEADVPVVTGLLCGPAAWGPRLPGVLGRAVTGIHGRLHERENAGPSVIDAAGRFIAVASLTSVRRWNTHTGDDLLQFGRTRVFRDLTDEERRAYGLP